MSEGETNRARQHQPQHRKVMERTVGESRLASPALSAGRGSPALLASSKESPSLSAGGEGVSDARGESGDHGEESRERKRRDRGDISGEVSDAALVKRLRPEGGELGNGAYIKGEANPYIKEEQAYKIGESSSVALKKAEAGLGGGYGSSSYSGVPEGLGPPGVEGCLPSQSAWPGYVLMPPPTHPPTQVHNHIIVYTRSFCDNEKVDGMLKCRGKYCERLLCCNLSTKKHSSPCMF